ncbi:hypothetical protein EASAB2608_04429 [Streptomyces sp. EAS-AB2608]|nr:hypothetical protein EASAB2608_04429 [Streptomyces sp. EAS-AB2608]
MAGTGCGTGSVPPAGAWLGVLRAVAPGPTRPAPARSRARSFLSPAGGGRPAWAGSWCPVVRGTQPFLFVECLESDEYDPRTAVAVAADLARSRSARRVRARRLPCLER